MPIPDDGPFKHGPTVPIPEGLLFKKPEFEDDVWPHFSPIISRWYEQESDAREANSFDHLSF